MKTTKLILTVGLIFLTVLAFSKPEPAHKSAKIKLSQALQSRGLVQAMYQQLDVSFLNSANQVGLITLRVKFRGIVYLISGKYLEWKNFFVMDQEDPDQSPKTGKRLASRVK